MRVDLDYLDGALERAGEKLKEMERELKETPEWEAWRKRFGVKANLTSRDQLGTVLFDVLGHPYPGEEYTADGDYITDINVLERVDTPFVAKFVAMMKMDKANTTYLGRIRRNVIGDRYYPTFSLHTARTYRSSSDLQNVPVRDETVAEIVRRCFTASPGCVIVENDLVGAEVKVAACYHKDSAMLDYINDPTKDMHRDMAAQLYMVPPEWVKKHGKEHRYGAKNKFVFPQFYGDYYVNCARALWDWAVRAKLKSPEDGVSLIQWLARHGVKNLSDFEQHVKSVEDDFWGRRFREYDAWKEQWYEDYLRDGGFETLTGFWIEGEMERNQVINYPVQGTAFHLLLWSITRINRILRQRKMRSRVMQQIHDSIVGDVVVEELKDYLDIVRQVITVDLLREFRWIIVPIAIENEICPPGRSWFHKRQVEWDGMDFSFTPKGAKEPFHTDSIKGILDAIESSFQTSHDQRN